MKYEAELMQQWEIQVDVHPVNDKVKQQRVRLECVKLLYTRDLMSAHASYPEEYETVRPPVR